jgi:1,4-dihydroxy-2-naphthoyl-CoA synthase
MATGKAAEPVWETILYEKKGGICHIVLNRPHKLNAASDQLVEDLVLTGVCQVCGGTVKRLIESA